MKKISWCKKKEGGIKTQEPNDNLSKEYYENAEESMKVLRSITKTKSNIKHQDWLGVKRQGVRQFVLVGYPSVGKSSLAEAVRERLSDRMSISVASDVARRRPVSCAW